MREAILKPLHITLLVGARVSILFSLSLLIIIFGTVPTVAEERSVNSGINSYYYDASHADWVPVFEDESREVYAQRHAILEAINIKPGMRIADIGAGTGFFSLLFAENVSSKGKVYAVDIAKDFVNTIEKKADLEGISNLVGIINNGRESGIPPHSIDLAFICDTYHHFEYPQSMMRSIYQALSDHGEVVIIDFRTDPDVSSGWVRHHVRAGREEVIKEMQDFGFELTEDLKLLRTNHFLRFKKR